MTNDEAMRLAITLKVQLEGTDDTLLRSVIALCDYILSDVDRLEGAQGLSNYIRTKPVTDAAKLLPCPLSDDQIRYMVDQFLGWRLPKPWHPDNGISYTRPNYMHASTDQDWPTGTNLFDYTQAEAMVRNMVEGLPTNNTRPHPAPHSNTREAEHE